jgi:hypothetical protein
MTVTTRKDAAGSDLPYSTVLADGGRKEVPAPSWPHISHNTSKYEERVMSEKVREFAVVFEVSGGSIPEGHKVRINATYTFTDDVPKDVAEWAVSNRVIASQRVVRALPWEHARALDGKSFTIPASQAGSKAAFETPEARKAKLKEQLKALLKANPDMNLDELLSD